MLADALRDRERRQASYRERALALIFWVCGRCGRAFQGKRLKELTVHHRNHNHDNNPPDGSNWELLCLYCHDNEHRRLGVADACGEVERQIRRVALGRKSYLFADSDKEALPTPAKPRSLGADE